MIEKHLVCVGMCSPALKVINKKKRQYAAVDRGIVGQRDEWEESGVPQTDISLAEYPQVTTETQVQKWAFQLQVM